MRRLPFFFAQNGVAGWGLGVCAVKLLCGVKQIGCNQIELSERGVGCVQLNRI